jgi:cyclopropane-fatty-acyl-phospholipid synthase
LIVTLESFITSWLGSDLPVRIEAYDGTRVGPSDAKTKVIVHSPDALIRLATAPGELGLARAYVAGDISIEGDIYGLLELRRQLPEVKVSPAQVAELVRIVGVRNLRRIPPPPEEHRSRGRLHTRRRDAAAISFHYDISNDFYRLVLGPSLTYSCAVFTDPSDTLEDAQANKYELISRKLGLEPGMRLLDIGCGWGGMVLHAAQHHGVEAVGVTISEPQAELGRKRVAEAGLSDRVEIRVQDYRDITDGPFDAISSIGMFEHVGMQRLEEYYTRVIDLLTPGGRLLNHAISRTDNARRRLYDRPNFTSRYVFPDGQLHEVGTVITALQDGGLEVRHMENLREHYALTLHHWVGNLERNWEAAVAEVGVGRARVWRLYMAASAVLFESDEAHVDQVLAVKPDPTGSGGLPLRPDWEPVRADETPPRSDGRRLRTHEVSAPLEARAMDKAELAGD